MIAASLEYSRQPDPAWQILLDELAPPHPLKSRLVIRWHGGREYFDDATKVRVWQPIERWIVWELIPTAMMSPSFPAVARMHAPGVEGGLELDRSMVDRAQWHLWLETGQYGRMVWIVQGTKGGNQRNFSEWQKLLLARRNLPNEPPYPGQLEYADFDGRALAALRTCWSKSKMWNLIAKTAEASWHTLDQEEQAEALQCREALADWSEEQMFDVLDSTTRRDRQEFRDALPHGLGRPDHLVDAGDALAAYRQGESL